MSFDRIFAIFLRHLFNLRHNLDRLVDALYWPSLDILIWGLTIRGLRIEGEVGMIQVSNLVFGVILWYMIWRGQGEVTVNLLEELWSENLVNIFATPLKYSEWLIGLCSVAFFKLLSTLVLTSGLAYLLYSVNFLSMGWYIAPYSLTLMAFGIAAGFFTSGLFFRFGTSIQTFAWAGVFVLMPFSAAFFPLDSLPVWVRWVAQFTPSSYIFEAMRAQVRGEAVELSVFLVPTILNVLYLILSLLFLSICIKKAHEEGLNKLR